MTYARRWLLYPPGWPVRHVVPARPACRESLREPARLAAGADIDLAAPGPRRTGCGVEPLSWRVIIYRLPAEPSRHRVAIWRELRRPGAVPLQQGTLAGPEGEGVDTGFAQVIDAIKTAGAQPVVLAVTGQDADDAHLEALFT